MNQRTGDAIRVGCRRHDWTQALFDQRVQTTALPLELFDFVNAGVKSVIGASSSLDFGECGLNQLLWARSRRVPVKALPVFIRCSFRHSYIFIRKDSGIQAPKDLEGKRVGTNYSMSANVWVRGLLKHEYGVHLERIHWLNQDSSDWLNQEGPETSYVLPAGLVLERVPKDINLQEWLIDGKLDALVHPDVVPSKLLAHNTVKRLFLNAAEEERKYYLRTRIIPMMDSIVFREEDIHTRPEVVKDIFEAFCRAKQLGLEAVQDNRHSGLLWYWESLEKQLEVVGYDPAPYSVEETRRTLETFVTYSVEQGLIPSHLPMEDLFYTP